MIKKQIVLIIIIFLWVALYPVYCLVSKTKKAVFTDRKEQLNPTTIIARLYRGENTPELLDFTAEFRVKKNVSEKETQEPAALEDFLKGKIYFKAPNKLRVDSSITVSDMFFGENFVVIRDGATEWIFKNKFDFPLKKRSDPQESSSYLPFYFQKYTRDLKRHYVLLGHEYYAGRPVYVMGMTSEEDPDRDVVKAWIDLGYMVPVKVERPIWKVMITKEYVTVENKKSIIERKKMIKTKNTILYKNIRQTSDGRWLPTQIESLENDVLMQVVYYDKVAVNFQLPDTLFAPQGSVSSF